MAIPQQSKSRPLERINDLWWLTLPAMFGRFSRTLSVVLLDGIYFSAWSVGTVILPITFVLGFLLAWLQPFAGEVYTFSILLMAMLLMLSHLGAGLGASVWLGYVLGDLLLSIVIPVLTSQQSYPPERVFLIVVTRFLADLLLANLLVVIPLTIRGLTRLTMWRLRFFVHAIYQRSTKPTPRSAADAKLSRGVAILMDIPVQVLLAVLLVYLWTQAVATLIRPVYTWRGSLPPIPAIQPLQNFGWMLATFAGCVGLVRVVLEVIADKSPSLVARRTKLGQALRRPESSRPLIVGLVSAPFKAMLLTFLLAGILNSWAEAIVLAVVLAVMFSIRAIAFAMLGFWSRLASYVPAAIRLVLALGISYLLSWPIVQVLWNQTSTFLPVLIGTVISLVVFSILLPGREPKPAYKSDQLVRKP